ncbi:putative riboflavin kinase [Xenia sp. Carnegie-2017]|uniref:putative riboflavin kinase n=1 Tax=Xenia sp. Carnegie-2017 TaxID=2897299 RepID=UPI001F045EEA|nr:putative riboflavin kinase [Xenia sp. Carnegie-2017]
MPSEMPNGVLPLFVRGEVVKGFGRGSKSLGIPTANYPDEVISKLPDSLETGAYYGFASVDGDEVYKMVLSVGWNPFFKNTKKSMETHILQTFPEDFYGKELRICIVGYIRQERSYPSLESLIDAIRNDISVAKEELDKPENQLYYSNPFLTDKSLARKNEVVLS